jgi:hypothetical protein
MLLGRHFGEPTKLRNEATKVLSEGNTAIFLKKSLSVFSSKAVYGTTEFETARSSAGRPKGSLRG